MTTEVVPKNAGFFTLYGNKSISGARKEYTATTEIMREEFGQTLRSASEKKCPYDYMAKDSIIEYNGVIFNCDYKKNAITLGDMSDQKRVLKINLPSGGSLHVNVENLGDISKAAGMFTPEDLEAIMRAIHEYNHCTRKLNEIEEEESEAVEDAAKENETPDAEDHPKIEDHSTISQINAYKTELYYKLLHGETETKIQIGSQELSVSEWDKLIEGFDKKQEYVREAMREEIEDRISDQEREEMLQKLFEERNPA